MPYTDSNGITWFTNGDKYMELKSARIRMRRTQEEVAEYAGITLKQYRKVEETDDLDDLTFYQAMQICDFPNLSQFKFFVSDFDEY